MKIQQLSNTLISKLSDVDNEVDGKIKTGVKNEVLENTSQVMIKGVSFLFIFSYLIVIGLH